MQTNGTIQVNDTLAIFVKDGRLAIGRDDGGLVTIDLPEVRHLVDALVTLAAEQATGQELAGLSQAAVAGWCADALMDNGARLDEVQAENLRLRGEIEKTYRRMQALKTELAEWVQAAEEAQDAQVGLRIPITGELSSKTTPADFERFAEMIGDANSK